MARLDYSLRRQFMKYRVLGKTGWKVSVVGFGAAPLGATHGAYNEKDGVRAVHTAIDLGINFIDVAPYYGLTMAESVLGKALKGIPREKYFLATKVGRHGALEKDFDFSPASIVRSVDESLTRLGVAHIDLIQCQDIEFASIPALVEETIPALQKLKRQGKVRRVGITGLPLKALRKVLERTSVDTVHSYCHFCLTNTTLVQLFPLLKEARVGIINAAPLGMGLLTDKGPPKWHPAPAKVREVCAKALAHCRKQKGSLPRLALQFAMSHREVATTLVGTSSAKKLKQCVKWMGETPDQSLLTEVQDILAPIRNRTWPSGRRENN
jgi:L-galactose dehydrogenase